MLAKMISNRRRVTNGPSATSLGKSAGVALQNEQLPLALVYSDGGIQKFFDFVKALVGCRCRLLHELVHNGVPPEVFNKALDGRNGIVCHERSVAGEAITATDIAQIIIRSRHRHPESPHLRVLRA